MAQLFHTVIYQPLFNLLVVLYNAIPGQDIGLAIIALALLVKLVFFPLTRKTLVHQKKMAGISSHVKRLQEEHKGDKEKFSKEVMQLYKDHGVRPLDGCLPLLIQIPVFIGLFQVFSRGFLPEAFGDLYSFVSHPGSIDPLFLGLVDLSQKSIVIAVLAGAIQFVHSKFFAPQVQQASPGERPGMGQTLSRQMVLVAPILTLIISLSLPAALPFYWFMNTLFTIAEAEFIKLRS